MRITITIIIKYDNDSFIVIEGYETSEFNHK